MKQNERILVYLVTGFLAVILVVAVFFGNDSNAASKEEAGNLGARSLKDTIEENMLDGPDGGPGGGAAQQLGGGEGGEQSTPNGSGQQHPLVASQPRDAAALVEQYLGESRRDRSVRIVRARAGDGLEELVTRWCGSRTPYLEEAEALNEDLLILRIGQEVVVPWVKDEDVLAAYEALQPNRPASNGTGTAAAAPATSPASPTFQLPGGTPAATDGAAAPAAAAGATVVHVVKPGESYWAIAAKLYGKGKATAMVEVIRRLNPQLGDTLQVNQKLVVPVAAR